MSWRAVVETAEDRVALWKTQKLPALVSCLSFKGLTRLWARPRRVHPHHTTLSLEYVGLFQETLVTLFLLGQSGLCTATSC